MAEPKINKTWVVYVATVFTAVLIVFFAVKIKNEILGRYRTIPAPNISITGEGKVVVRPDIATVSIGVGRNDKEVAKAQSAATITINKVIEFLKEKGVEDRDIKTTNYSIGPRYDYRANSQPKIIGYEVRQTLEVKIRDLSKSGEILSVGSLGANEIGSLRFTVDNLEKAKEEARNMAIKDAREKAKNLSKNLGVRFGRIISFYESNGGIQPLYLDDKIMSFGGATPVPVSVPTGENEIKAQVTITYEVE